MPRGGGRARAGTARIAGVDIPIDDDFDPRLPPPHEPGVLFPNRVLKTAHALSKEEKAQIAAWTSLRNQIHDGPLFTTMPDAVKVRLRKEAVSGSAAAVVIPDPFDGGVESYGLKYLKGKRKAPALGEEREYVLEHFPRELWGVLDSRYASSDAAMARKKAKVDLKKVKAKLDALPDDGEEKDGDDEGRKSDEEAPEAAFADDDFEDDEDDMAGDYNAEQYFDDGGDDAGDDYNGGDGGGDDGMY